MLVPKYYQVQAHLVLLRTTLLVYWNIVAEIQPIFLRPLFSTVQGGHQLVVTNTHQYYYRPELAHWSTKTILWTCVSYKARMVGYRYIKWQAMCYVSCLSPQKDSFHLYVTRILYSSPSRQNLYGSGQSSSIEFHQQDDEALHLFCALSRATTTTHHLLFSRTIIINEGLWGNTMPL
jgi:hypothetical protein